MLMKEAVTVFGTKKRLAEVLGLQYQSVRAWGEEIPENRIAHIRTAIELELLKKSKTKKPRKSAA